MANNNLYIKNMVCDRCIRVVQEELENLGLTIMDIKLGEVVVKDEGNLDYEKIAQTLSKNGFELLDDRKAQLIEKIKNTVIELIHNKQTVEINFNFSYIIQQQLGVDYHYLSSLFSVTEGVTIEKYIILQRIEKAKELLVYDELSLSQIADQLAYSSVAHLSAQFKKETGITPSAYKKLSGDKRKSLDKV